MPKYFDTSDLLLAVNRLRESEGKWVLIPFVLGANGVSAAEVVDVSTRLGTDRYLEKFFKGSIIGLAPRRAGSPCFVRPLFKDLAPDMPGHVAKKTDGKIWANTFSQSGYGTLRDSGKLVKTTGSNFQLTKDFASWFRGAIPTTFKFEDLLLWCYAFTGVPGHIASWKELYTHFALNHTFEGKGFPAEYSSVFTLTPGEPWPLGFRSSRPENREFQDLLLPGTSSCDIEAEQFKALHDELQRLLVDAFLEFSPIELAQLSVSIVSALQSCKRLFLLGEPGTGKSELAWLISSAFENVFGDRVHAVTTTIADGSSPDKLIGFSTLDGSWVDGILTQAALGSGKKLLYALEGAPPSLPLDKRRQVNVIVLDEANRRDIEDLLSKLQTALDSDSSLPEHLSYVIKLDNAGEQLLSPNTFLVMTGNSPREDMGRVVQSRPFKRRHGLIIVPNVFDKVLGREPKEFGEAMAALWEKRGAGFSISIQAADGFRVGLETDLSVMGGLRDLLSALKGYSIGVSYGLVKKILKAAGSRFALTNSFAESMDIGTTDAVFSVLSSEVVLEGKSVRDQIAENEVRLRPIFPHFYATVDTVLKSPDNFNRVRAFL